MSVGSLFGALLGAYTSDWWGRRRNLSFGVIIFVLGNIVQITAMESWIHMMMGRFFAGIGVGILSVGKFEENFGTAMDSTNMIQAYPCSSRNVAHVRSEAQWYVIGKHNQISRSWFRLRTGFSAAARAVRILKLDHELT